MTTEDEIPPKLEIEADLTASLVRKGYRCEVETEFFTDVLMKKMKVDLVAKKNDTVKLLILFRWQESHGTTERKLPFDVILLSSLLKSQLDARGVIVLGGSGWTLLDFYTSDRFLPFFQDAARIEIATSSDINQIG